MGYIGAWLKVIIGLFVLGASFIYTQPLFDLLFAIGTSMGGNALHVQTIIQGELKYIPTAMSLSMILWGFIDATRSENNSGWR